VAKASYHHGNLRRALLDAALAVIAESGPNALSLRELASRTGVSHAAPAHHFGDKAGLLTAVAAEGYERLADELEQAARDGDFREAGLAYVRFATRHPAHFQVMFQPALYRVDDPSVAAAESRAAAVLYGTAGAMPAASGDSADSGDSVTAIGVAGWCLVHGLATLWLAGNLAELADDPVDLARSVTAVTFGAAHPHPPPAS
jgi:AcrR family transcriptional regulator